MTDHFSTSQPPVHESASRRPHLNFPAGSVEPDGLATAFWAYETALSINDLDALDTLFATGADTLRGDAGGLLIGHDQIAAFRRGRGGARARKILSVHVRPIGREAALIIAVTSPAGGGRGQQTQLWRFDAAGGWRVEAAHVSIPAPAMNESIWRVVGSPLVRGADEGALVGQSVAVKDLFAVAGHPIGGGVPVFLAERLPEGLSAPAVTALLDAGAHVTGIAHTDEFAYSIEGRNPHYGTPPNAAVAGAIPGGSSSGVASAVAAGQVSIGLGTDSGGSIRVPASYQGLWGLRSTHAAVDRARLLALSASFDTVGWLTREPGVLTAVVAASLDPIDHVTLAPRFAVSSALIGLADAAIAAVFSTTIQRLGFLGEFTDLLAVDLGDLDELSDTFRTIQAAEAWAAHGEWITAHPGALGEDIAARFAWAATIDGATEAAARVTRVRVRASIEAVLDGRVLLLPSASSTAPSVMVEPAVIEQIRSKTIRLTSIAGLLGAPALSAPLMSVGGAPAGFCLVGPRFSDLALVRLGSKFATALHAAQ